MDSFYTLTRTGRVGISDCETGKLDHVGCPLISRCCQHRLTAPASLPLQDIDSTTAAHAAFTKEAQFCISKRVSRNRARWPGIGVVTRENGSPCLCMKRKTCALALQPASQPAARTLVLRSPPACLRQLPAWRWLGSCLESTGCWRPEPSDTRNRHSHAQSHVLTAAGGESCSDLGTCGYPVHAHTRALLACAAVRISTRCSDGSLTHETTRVPISG